MERWRVPSGNGAAVLSAAEETVAHDTGEDKVEEEITRGRERTERWRVPSGDGAAVLSAAEETVAHDTGEDKVEEEIKRGVSRGDEISVEQALDEENPVV
ncbi:hypothetical protein LR48_Vigan08g113600 [Vigna angularis]|uniref:Uncharacterized protein n=1 Tax=Phaseolus angularis TaxID=3914 RepID=A0A0L9V6J6_PHAAN|nr:hypothetical protein LR48_Vigan08g113600 [Vigna angularis]